MSKIIEIEDALNRINGDIFQEFCNHFLFYKLNPNSIEPIGSVIGKEKSRKGIPDSFITSGSGQLVFAAYTTKENLGKGKSFIKKLKLDIKDCFNTKKTGVHPEEIKKVVLCFTSRLNPQEHDELNLSCKSFNNECVLQLYGIRDLSYAVLDYPLLATYLNVVIDTGQIQMPSDFITEYEKNRFSTPLSNKFLGREKELNEGLKKLSQSDILMVLGTSGTGKSKYAFELSKQYCELHQNYTFLCIANKGLELWQDLQNTLRKDKNYMVLVDDANRLATNFKWLLNIVNEPNRQNIKVIFTVRDYAANILLQIIEGLNYDKIEIPNFSKDELTAIIKSEDFNIQNPAFIQRIMDIAKGNARLAIMCARVAKESDNLLSLTDASQIYDEYFKKLFQEIDLLKEDKVLISLALIAFFGTINKENQEFCSNIFLKVKLEEEYFWEICYKLNELEVVDLYEQQIVKISDQILSTYIFYKVVIEKESLSFRFFLDNYLESENRIIDTIIPVIKIFSYKKVEEKIKIHILSKWGEIDQLKSFDKSLKYLDLFWFYLYPQILVYFKKYIDNLDEPTDKRYRYSYELNEFSYGTEKIIEVLSRFHLLELETFKDAFELLLYYGIKIPEKLPAIIYTIKERFIFTRLSYQYNDVIQHIVLDTLILKSQGENSVIFENILEQILPHFLKIEYNESSSEGRQITLYTFHIWLSESIKEFRKKCFEILENKAVCNKKMVLKTIYNLPIFDYKHSNEIFEFDKDFIFPIIYKHFDNQKFEDCFVLLEVIDKIEILQKDYPVELKTNLRGKVFDFVEVLKPEKNHKKKSVDWHQEEEDYRNEIIAFTKDFQKLEMVELFDNINVTLEIVNQNHVEWQLCNALEIILSNIGKVNPILFSELLGVYFDKYNFRLNFLSIFYSFFSVNSKYYLKLFSTIPTSRIDIKINFHQALKTDDVTKEDLSLLYDDLKLTFQSIANHYSFWDLTFISKYAIHKNELVVYDEISDILLSNCDNGISQICFGIRFINKCLEIQDYPLVKVAKVYFYSNKYDPHFDYNKEVLKKLVAKDYTILIQLLAFTHPARISYHDTQHQNFEFIWELPNYEGIIQSLFDFFAREERYFSWERAIIGFFPKNINNPEDKPFQFLHKTIQERHHDVSYIELVFNILCYTYPTFLDEFLKEFLALNSDFEVFTKLELVPRSGVYMGSRVPQIQKQRESWVKVLSVIETMQNRIDFLEHKDYVLKQISYCDLDIKRETKWEIMEESYL